MSLFLSRFSLSLRTHLTARCFSSSSIYYILGAEPSLRDGDIGNLKIHALGCGDRVTEKKVPMELLKEMGTIGASHGWVAVLKNGVVHIQDDLNVSASDINPKRISLPRLVTLAHCQTKIVTNVAMSSSSPEDEECIVAVKFMGPQLSLCRPAQRNCKWTNIRITDPSFFSSHVMYSKREEMFSMPASRGHYTGSWDLGKYKHKPKLKMLQIPDHPEMTKSEWQRLDSCCMKQHYLVESRNTGETFMLKWYTESRPPRKSFREWDHFLVLRLDEEGNAVYTKDIGDVSIFLSKAESFCLPASLYGVPENCVFFLGKHDFGIVRLSDHHKGGGPLTHPKHMDWCFSSGSSFDVEVIHGHIIKIGLEEDEVTIRRLMDLYVKVAQQPKEANVVFQHMVSAYAPQKQLMIKFYWCLDHASVINNGLRVVQGLHSQMLVLGLENTDRHVGMLMSSYTRVALHPELACLVFSKLKSPGYLAWRNLIWAYANHDPEKAISVFGEREKTHIKPTLLSFWALVYAHVQSNHAKEVLLDVLLKMKNVYNLKPDVTHFGCYMDKLVKTGDIERPSSLLIQWDVQYQTTCVG